MLILEDEKEFFAKSSEQIKQVEKNGKIILTKFLTQREQEIIRELARLSGVEVRCFGGYENAERCKCLLSNECMTISDSIFNLSCYKIKYNKRYLDLTHRNVLGTLMSLNLDRALFGDIVFADGDCFIFFSSEIENIILQEFTMINRAPITLEKVTETIRVEMKYETKEIIVSSMRLDAIISHVYRLSREDAQALFSNHSVYKNYQLITNQSAKCEEDDNISVRKYGRFIVSKILRNTKSSKIVLEIKIPTV